MILFKSLSEDFDRHDGDVADYISDAMSDIPARKHYDLRAFWNMDITVPRTMIDFDYENALHWDEAAMLVLDRRRSLAGREPRERQVQEVDAIDPTILLSATMDYLDFIDVGAGDEEWSVALNPPGARGIDWVGKDTNDPSNLFRYANQIVINTFPSVTKSITSRYKDDILTDFNEFGKTYYLDFVIRQLPTNTAISQIDLNNSYIDITSGDLTYAAADTDTIPFSSSINPLNVGTGTGSNVQLSLVTGNVVNDATRTTSVDGDGRAAEGTYGVWRQSTNLVLDSSFETDVSRLSTSGPAAWISAGATVSRVTTEHKFGTAAARVQGSGANNGVSYALGFLQTGIAYTATVWVKGSVTGGSVQLSLGSTTGTSVSITPTGTWQKVAATWTADNVAAYVSVRHSAAGAMDIYIDGLQVEQQPFATPFIQTSSVAGTRSVGRVQADSMGISTPRISSHRGWVAFRVRPGYGSTVSETVRHSLWSWSDGVRTMFVRYDPNSDTWVFDSAGGTVSVATPAFNAGDSLTVIAAWTETNASLSINGAAFTSTARTDPPSILHTSIGSLFDVGSGQAFIAGEAFDGDIFWMLTGTDTITNANAATVHGYGDTGTSTISNVTFGRVTMHWKANDNLVESWTYGYDTYLRVNRNILVKVDKTKITGVRLRLRSTGEDVKFRAQAMRIIASDYVYAPVDMDTKRQLLRRSLPQAGYPEPSTTPLQIYLFAQTRPLNMTEVVKFNNGHNPISPNANKLSLFARWTDSNNYLRVIFSVNDQGSGLVLYQMKKGVLTTLASSPLSANILNTEQDYYLKLSIEENNVSVGIYSTYGVYFGPLVYEVKAVTTLKQRGYFGFELDPYNYDFILDYVRNLNAEFARYEGKNFPSVTPVIGAALLPDAAAPVNLTSEEEYIPLGDITIETDSAFGNPPPSLKLTRGLTASGYYGGYMTANFIFLGNLKHVAIRGSIFPIGAYQGEYRIVLVDKNNSIAFIDTIEGILPNRWNEFETRILVDNVAPAGFRVILQKTGLNLNESFYLDNFRVEHDSVTWEASANGGIDYQDFFTALNSRYEGVNFWNRGTDLRVRAVAHSDTAWIAGFELIPKYGYNPIASSYKKAASWGIRVSGMDATGHLHREQTIHVEGIGIAKLRRQELHITGAGL